MRNTRNLILMALFAALTAVGAFLKIPIPMMPFTLQLLFTTLAGILLGSRYGAMSVGCYVLLGLIGFPVFTAGGGPAYILQPTFGYLIGFIGGAWLTGRIAEQSAAPSFKRLLVAGLAGLVVVYLLGGIYYWGISNFYLGTKVGALTLLFTFFPGMMLGDLLLCVLAAVLGKRLVPVLRKGASARV